MRDSCFLNTMGRETCTGGKCGKGKYMYTLQLIQYFCVVRKQFKKQNKRICVDNFTSWELLDKHRLNSRTSLKKKRKGRQVFGIVQVERTVHVRFSSTNIYGACEKASTQRIKEEKENIRYYNYLYGGVRVCKCLNMHGSNFQTLRKKT